MSAPLRAVGSWFSGIGLLIVAGASAVVIILVIAAMWTFGFGLFTDTAANRQGQTQKERQVEGNGAYRIAAYDHFYDLCATVQSDRQVLSNTRSLLRTTTDATSKATLTADVLAQENKLATDVNQYNADARKSYTAGQFRASDLPSHLPPTGDTTCHGN